MNNNYSISLETATKVDEQNYIVFELRENKYAININNVAKIISIPSIETPQKTPEGIIGIFDYNGIFIKVVDLSFYLGFETLSFNKNNQVIVVYENGEYFAIYTNNIENVQKFEINNIKELPFKTENSILERVFKKDNNSINIIDCKALHSSILKSNESKGVLNLVPKNKDSDGILNQNIKKQMDLQDTFSFPIDLPFSKQYILFRMDNQNYYLDIKCVKEFISLNQLNITKLPYTPEYVTGIASVKGEFLVVINLKKFIYNEDRSEIPCKKLIVVESRDFNIGFLVDEIKYIKNLSDIKKTKMYSSNQECIYAEFMENNEIYSILNYDKIINDNRLYINIE